MRKSPNLKQAMTPFPYSVEPDAPIEQAEQLMEQRGVRHLPVTREHMVVGVISDRDMKSVLQLRARSGDVSQLKVQDLYVPDPYVVSLDEPIDNVLLTMAKRHIGSAVVTKGGKLVGMFTSVDACRIFGEYLREHFPRSTGDDVA